MRQSNILLVGLCALGILSGCQRAEDPAKVKHDVAEARDTAIANDEKADQAAQKRIASAESNVESAQRDAQHVSAEQQQKVAATDAEGVRKVMLAACESLSGDDRKACRDKADADYERAKVAAQQMRTAQDPKQ
ncbi:MAG TPA: hypothetical protein VNX02_05255 [Steroidobacteraceae bacterium]|jgi:hypothetical protein|nr:hypothetical protein [Steroidobacteraceae bacterium]